jgi:1-deoxy-D-xylulose-5-phosphate reductoisomerase
MKHISILGSTGSIGCNTLKVVEHLGDIRVTAMAAGRNIARFIEQVTTFKPEIAACADEHGAEQLERALHNLGSFVPKILVGDEGLIAVATADRVDTVVSATVGAVGFVPTLRAIESGKRVALANKETLVMAGELMTAAAASSGAEILPVDSEHNAIHQCLRGERSDEVRRIILTASGGPFRTWSSEQMAAATRDEALNHPNWRMGDKITIDSATLMNKGLEVIEAKWLFGLDADRISVIVHPQSVVHSMVEMLDGSVIAQMGVTDMKHAIQYSLTYPDRLPNCLPPLDLAAIGKLDFEEPDTKKFPCLALAFDALRIGGTMPAALNAANEVSVEAFLDGKITIDQIAEINRRVMDLHAVEKVTGLDVVLAVDKWARETAGLSLAAATSTASN